MSGALEIYNGATTEKVSVDNPLPTTLVGGAAPGEVPAANPVLLGSIAAATPPSDTADGQVVYVFVDPKGRVHTVNDGSLDPATDALALGASASSPGSLETHLSDALVATAVAVKATGGRLHLLYVENPNAFKCWVHFYDVAAAGVTVGSTTRKYTFPIPASYAGPILVGPVPIGFATAIAIAATKTDATGSTAPDTGLGVFIGYK